jgi:Flp pilus assembly protein TadD
MASPLTENSKSERTLVSWKEIAAFLNRAERTVKRWERERGLPVHRVPGGERGGVYAFAAELDAWLNSAKEPGTGPVHGPDRSGNGDQETAGGARTNAATEGRVDPQPGEVVGRSGKLGDALRLKLAIVGVAAALAGAGVYASIAHPIGHWIQQRFPVLAGIARPSSIGQVAAPVSDAEKSMAHDLYLEGRFEWNQRTPDSLNRALDDFTQAIVHNPNDARAYAGLADSYEMLFIYGNRQDDDARDRAMAAAGKAVELDGSLSEAHRALGYAAWRTRNFGEAEKELNLAIQLDPKDPLAHLWLSNVLANQGKNADCLAEINKAQELDPASASILAMKGERLYMTGKKDEGIAILEAAIRSEPRLSIAHLYLAQIEFLERNYYAYLRESQAAAELRNDPWLKGVTASLSAAYARDGDRGLLNAEFAVEESCNAPIYRWRAIARTRKAIDCLAWGRKPEALQLLEEASANHEKEFEDFRAQFNSGPSRDTLGVTSNLGDDPRFQALMKQKADLPKTAKRATSHESGTL